MGSLYSRVQQTQSQRRNHPVCGINQSALTRMRDLSEKSLTSSSTRRHNECFVTTKRRSMTSEGQAAEPASVGPDETGRGRSSIDFPYFDLASAIELAQAVKEVGG